MRGKVQQSIFTKKNCFEMVTGGPALISLQVQIEITFCFILRVRGNYLRRNRLSAMTKLESRERMELMLER